MKWNKFAIAALVLFVPSTLYLLMYSGRNHYRHLEIYGPRDVRAPGDTLYHTVPPFAMTDQDGQPFTDAGLGGRIYVASFFFVTCPDICPKMNNQVRRAAEAFKNDSGVAFVSFTVNPGNDTPAVLKAYAEKTGATGLHWSFLTGPKDSIYALAANGYLVYAAQGKEANQFFHSQDLILVDRDRRIRGIYDGLTKEDVDTLIDEIKVLQYEYREKAH